MKDDDIAEVLAAIEGAGVAVSVLRVADSLQLALDRRDLCTAEKVVQGLGLANMDSFRNRGMLACQFYASRGRRTRPCAAARALAGLTKQ